MTIRDEIAAFFAAYLEAFARRDADALSEFWEPVGLFPSPNGNFAMPRDAFHDHCVTLMDFYRGQGVVRPLGRLLSASELFPGVAEARMAYRMHGEGDETIAEWEHVYMLRRSERWRVTDDRRRRDGGPGRTRRGDLPRASLSVRSSPRTEWSA